MTLKTCSLTALFVLTASLVSAQTQTLAGAAAIAAAQRAADPTAWWPILSGAAASPDSIPAPLTTPDATVVVVGTQAVVSTTPVVKNETYWKDRMRSLHTTLDGDQVLLDAAIVREAPLNKKIHGNADDLVAIRDSRMRAELQSEWQAVVTEISRLKAAVITDNVAIVNLEQEARRAHVLPGWLLP